MALITVWFGAAHVFVQFGAWSSLAYIFFVGFVMTALREVTKSTLPSILLHVTYNTTFVVAVVVEYALGQP